MLILIGGVLVAVGLLVRYVPGLFGWFGNLPGDVSIESGNSRVFIPVTSMIVVSVVLTLAANLVALVLRNR